MLVRSGSIRTSTILLFRGDKLLINLEKVNVHVLYLLSLSPNSCVAITTSSDNCGEAVVILDALGAAHANSNAMRPPARTGVGWRMLLKSEICRIPR